MRCYNFDSDVDPAEDLHHCLSSEHMNYGAHAWLARALHVASLTPL